MNPRSDAPSASGPPTPLPTHTHELTKNETLELGFLAVEEPHPDAATVAPMGVPASQPLPPTTVVAPQQRVSMASGSSDEVTTSGGKRRNVIQPLSEAPKETPTTDSVVPPPEAPISVSPEPAAPVAASDAPVSGPTPPTPSAAPSPAPEPAAAPRTTPAKAPDIIPPSHPPANDVLAGQDVLQAVSPPKQIDSSPIERMELSANSMNLRSVSRLHALGVVMNIVVIVLIIGIAAGGWFAYKYLMAGGRI